MDISWLIPGDLDQHQLAVIVTGEGELEFTQVDRRFPGYEDAKLSRVKSLGDLGQSRALSVVEWRVRRQLLDWPRDFRFELVQQRRVEVVSDVSRGFRSNRKPRGRTPHRVC